MLGLWPGQKFESYLQSVEAKTAELKTSMTELWNNLLPGDFIGNITEAGTAVVQFTDKYNILRTALKSALFFGMANGLVSTVNGLKGMVTSLTNVSAAMNLASKGATLTTTEFTTLKAITKGLSPRKIYHRQKYNRDMRHLVSHRQINRLQQQHSLCRVHLRHCGLP